jgi:hypothetical protein
LIVNFIDYLYLIEYNLPPPVDYIL